MNEGKSDNAFLVLICTSTMSPPAEAALGCNVNEALPDPKDRVRGGDSGSREEGGGSLQRPNDAKQS